MQNKKRGGKTRVSASRDKNFAVKTTLQSITALILFLIVWGFSVSNNPQVNVFCDKIRHYLTYTIDVQSVFKPIYEKTDSLQTENNTPEVNENVH